MLSIPWTLNYAFREKKTGLHRETGLGQRRKTSNLFQIDHNGGEKPAWEENHQEENQNREGGKKQAIG